MLILRYIQLQIMHYINNRLLLHYNMSFKIIAGGFNGAFW